LFNTKITNDACLVAAGFTRFWKSNKLKTTAVKCYRSLHRYYFVQASKYAVVK